MEIHREVEKGKIKVVTRLLEEGVNVDARDDRAWTPLSVAAYNGHYKIAQLLISKGADVNAKEERRGTVLHKVAENPRSWGWLSGLKMLDGKRHLEIAELLIQEGADVNAKGYRDHKKYRPLHLAVANWGNIKMVELFLSKGAYVDGYTIMHDAVGGQDLQIIELLISKGADVNVKNANGHTPLKVAVDSNKTSVAKLLKKLGGYE